MIAAADMLLPLLGAGLAMVGHAPAVGRGSLRPRGPAQQVVMKAVPRVPFKSRDSEYTQWVDVYNRMYRERIIFLSQDIDDDFANVMISVLLYLESEDAKSPVSMYFNVAGGKTKPGLALHDTMTNMPYDIQTVNMGLAAETSAFLIAGGTPGKRFALPNSRFLMQVLPPFTSISARRPFNLTPGLSSAEPEHDASAGQRGQAASARHASDRDEAGGGRGPSGQATSP